MAHRLIPGISWNQRESLEQPSWGQREVLAQHGFVSHAVLKGSHLVWLDILAQSELQ